MIHSKCLFRHPTIILSSVKPKLKPTQPLSTTMEVLIWLPITTHMDIMSLTLMDTPPTWDTPLTLPSLINTPPPNILTQPTHTQPPLQPLIPELPPLPLSTAPHWPRLILQLLLPNLFNPLHHFWLLNCSRQLFCPVPEHLKKCNKFFEIVYFSYLYIVILPAQTTNIHEFKVIRNR